MKLGEAPRQLPINVGFECASRAPKSSGLLRAGSREGELGREKMIDSMVLSRVTLDKSHPLARAQVPAIIKEASGLGDSSQLPAEPFAGKTLTEC